MEVGTSGLYIYPVENEGTRQDLLAILPPEEGFEMGLPVEAIAGVFSVPIESEADIAPEHFARNPNFVEMLQQAIALCAPTLPEVLAQAQAIGDGHIYVIDSRTPDPDGEIPSEDILGAFEAQGGNLVPDSYQPNPHHRLLSSDGLLFQLDSRIRDRLLADIRALRSEI